MYPNVKTARNGATLLSLAMCKVQDMLSVVVYIKLNIIIISLGTAKQILKLNPQDLK